MKILIPTLINGAAYSSAVLLKSAGHVMYMTYDKVICDGIFSNSQIFSETFEITAPKGTLVKGYVDRPNTVVEDAYLSTICSVCKTHGIEVIWPFDDVQIAFFARNAQHIRSTGLHLIAADYAAVCVCSDKHTVISQAAEAKFPAPQSARCASVDEVLDVFRAYGGRVVVKTAFTTGSKGVRYFDNSELLAKFCGNALQTHSDVVVQEFIDGSAELSLNYLLGPNSEVLCSFALEKHRHLLPSFSTAIRVAPEPAALTTGITLLRTLGLTGFCVIQTRRDDSTGIYKLVEINPRMGNNARILMSFGINFPILLLNSSLGHNVEAVKLAPNTCGVSPIEDLLTFYSFLRVSHRIRKGRLVLPPGGMPGLMRYVGSCLHWYLFRRPYVDQHFRNLIGDTAANVGYYRMVIKQLRTAPDMDAMLGLLPWGRHATK